MICKIINNYSLYAQSDFFQKLSTRKYCTIALIALSIFIGYCSLKFVRAHLLKTKKLQKNDLQTGAILNPIINPSLSQIQKSSPIEQIRKESSEGERELTTNSGTENQAINYKKNADDLFQEAEKYRTENPGLSFQYFLKAAQMNHVKAQLKLGMLYKDGRGITKNEKQAFKWFNKAAIAGNIQAQFNLSVCYSKEIGTRKEVITAFKWMKHAAEAGYVKAQFYLAVNYLNGCGTTKNKGEAFNWFKKAAENGYIEAQYSTARCYQFGTGINKDLIQAFNWYKLAAEADFGKAQYQLSTFYYTGTGVVQDYNQGLKWVTRAAESNDLEALAWLANEYYAEDRYEEAFRLYLQAAKLGDIVAQVTVAEFYESGEMVGKDLKEAYFWYCKATENGCELAIEWIKNFG